MIPKGKKDFVFDFYPDEKVKVKQTMLHGFGGLKKVEGYIDCIRVDRNGVWYEIITSDTLGGKPFSKVTLLGSYLESIERPEGIA